MNDKEAIIVVEKKLGIPFRLNLDANICGTSGKGNIEAVYSRIVEVFGEPVESDGYKISGEWIFEDDQGGVFTLYDWKSTDLYDSDCPTVEEFRAVSDRQTFNIGGSRPAAEFILWLEAKLNGKG